MKSFQDIVTISVLVLSFISFCHPQVDSTQINNDPLAPQAHLPVVMWHGMGDSCCNPLSLGSLIPILQEHLPGAYVKSLQIGKDFIEDTENGFFMNVNSQIKDACKQLADDPKLKNGYNAIGFSQGGQFLRGVAQRCPSPPMRTLVSLGGQHQGVYGLPHCFSASHKVCDYIRMLLNKGAYWRWVQRDLVQAEYWHDPLAEEKYRARSLFLSDINNELTVNPSYVENLARLTKLVLVRFNNDSMVQPRETSWFGFYAPGQDKEVLALRQTRLYTEDRLGLKQLDQSGRLDFVSLDGDHLQFSKQWFVDEIILKYLSQPVAASNNDDFNNKTNNINNNNNDPIISAMQL